jgi:hypothetical protein
VGLKSPAPNSRRNKMILLFSVCATASAFIAKLIIDNMEVKKNEYL